MVDLYMARVYEAPPAVSDVGTGDADAASEPISPTTNPHTITYATKGQMLDYSDMMTQMYDIVNQQTAEIEQLMASRYTLHNMHTHMC